MRWRTHVEKPAFSCGPDTALVATRDDMDALYLVGIYIWRGDRWESEDTGRTLSTRPYWWVPETELLAAIPSDTSLLTPHSSRGDS